MEISLGSVSILRVTGPTVTLQNNNEHDDTEQQQQRLRSHHDHLVRRFLHPQLPKIIIASLEECKSRIVLVFWHADDLVADMATLYINDNTSDLAKRRRFPREKPDRDKTDCRQSFAATNCRPDLAIQSDPSRLCSAALGIVQTYNGSGIVGHLGL